MTNEQSATLLRLNKQAQVAALERRGLLGCHREFPRI